MARLVLVVVNGGVSDVGRELLLPGMGKFVPLSEWTMPLKLQPASPAVGVDS